MTVMKYFLLSIAAALSICPIATAVAAQDTESRLYSITVDKKPVGQMRETVARANNGTVTFTSEANVHMRVLIVSYNYNYRSREIWRDGRLQSFESSGDDDGHKFDVRAQADNGQILVEANGKKSVLPADSWTSSHWRLPQKIGSEMNSLETDTGNNLKCKLTFVSNEQIQIGQDKKQCQHYKLTGADEADLWYDGPERVVRENSTDQGRRTVVELKSVTN
jgi:hypothetical protein